MKELLSLENLTMSSVEIAVLMGKEHKHVMRDIRGVITEIDSQVHDSDSKIGKLTSPNLDWSKYPELSAPVVE